MARQNVKLRLIEKGAEIIYIRGFNNTGINDILRAAGVPKGSFYHYFKDKEDYGVQLVGHFLIRFVAAADACLSQPASSWVGALRGFFNDFLCFFQSNDFKGGCPIANFSLEMSDLNESIRKKLEEAFETMSGKVSLFLEKAKDNGELPDDLDIATSASFILNSWEGALLRTKVSKNSGPLKLFERFTFDKLLNKT
ncbi:MAG TPA: TetR family transcriptional regulator C-terminal domain-containing protein [Syntrophobacteraceae bacterium]|nr:TetR family transcriptional regulator C-terminal domain-containing protein [Syntrophobacteraceae bacterium]